MSERKGIKSWVQKEVKNSSNCVQVLVYRSG